MARGFAMKNDTFPSNQSISSMDDPGDALAGPTGRAMELRHLRYFAALAEQLNFTRAAETVHVTQSTLSHQIKQLETEIGHRLFDRIGKRIVITEAGEQLLGRVKHALSEIDGGLRAVRGSAQQLSGNLRIGVTVLQRQPAARLHRHLLRQAPPVRVTVQELNAESVARGVEARDFDIGIAYRPNSPAAISFEPLCNDEMAPWSRLGIRWRVESAFAWSSCTARSSCSRPAIPPRASCSKAGFARSAEPVVVVEMNPIASALALVRRIEAGAIISRQALTETADLHVIPIENRRRCVRPASCGTATISRPRPRSRLRWSSETP